MVLLHSNRRHAMTKAIHKIYKCEPSAGANVVSIIAGTSNDNHSKSVPSRGLFWRLQGSMLSTFHLLIPHWWLFLAEEILPRILDTGDSQHNSSQFFNNYEILKITNIQIIK